MLAETERGGSGPERVGGVSSGGALVMVCLLAHRHYISEYFSGVFDRVIEKCTASSILVSFAVTVFVFVNLFLGGILSGGALLVNVMACLHALWHHQGISLHLFMHCFAGLAFVE